MSFEVTINEFEGPLDLMLHLVAKEELDLFNLNIDVLTTQYLNYLNSMKELHLEIESEYLVELATLIEYKSKKLLPKDQSKIEDEYEEDPSVALANRLIMYQKFKDVSEELKEMYMERMKQHSKPMENIVEDIQNTENEIFSVDGNAYDLLKAMKNVMMRLQLQKPFEVKVTQKDISIDECITMIKAKLIDLPKTFSFEKLIEDSPSLSVSIVMFLAVLDLIKQQFFVFKVDENETIWLQRGA